MTRWILVAGGIFAALATLGVCVWYFAPPVERVGTCVVIKTDAWVFWCADDPLTFF